MALLDEVLDAHGGLALWQQMQQAQGVLDSSGQLFEIKNQTSTQPTRSFTVAMHEIRASLTAVDAGAHIDFRADGVALTSRTGSIEQERVRENFAGHDMYTPWSAAQRERRGVTMAIDETSRIVTESIDIEASPEQVWALLTSSDQITNWYDKAGKVTQLHPVDTFDVGSRFVLTHAGTPRRCVVTAMEPIGRLSWTEECDGEASVFVEFRLERLADGGTRLTHTKALGG